MIRYIRRTKDKEIRLSVPIENEITSSFPSAIASSPKGVLSSGAGPIRF